MQKFAIKSKVTVPPHGKKPFSWVFRNQTKPVEGVVTKYLVDHGFGPMYLVFVERLKASQWVPASVVKAVVEEPAKPTRTFGRKSQCGMLLAHLSSGKTINRIEADHMYRVAALPRRIKDLTEAGHKITSKTRLDATGRPFAEYAMRNAGRIW